MQCSGSGPEWFISDPDPALNFSNPYYRSIFWKKTSNSIKQKNLPTISHFLFHTAVRQRISPEFTGFKLENKIWIYLLIYSCQIRNNNSESGLRKKFWIHNTGSSSVAEPKLWFIFGSGSTFVHNFGSSSNCCHTGTGILPRKTVL